MRRGTARGAATIRQRPGVRNESFSPGVGGHPYTPTVAQVTADPLIGRLVDGRYQIVARVARGGMATVYRAHDSRLNREIALKVMHPHLADGEQAASFRERFEREARSAAGLQHHGVVAV